MGRLSGVSLQAEVTELQTDVSTLETEVTRISTNWLGLDNAFMPWRSGGFWYSLQSTMPCDHGGVQALAANEIYGCPLWPQNQITIDRVGFAVQTGLGTSTRLMAHAPLDNGLPGALLFDFGLVSTATAGDKAQVVSAQLPAGLVWLTCIPDAAISAYCYQSMLTWQFAGLAAFQAGGNEYTPHRANGSQVAPDPFGTSGVTWITQRFLRLAVRTA